MILLDYCFFIDLFYEGSTSVNLLQTKRFLEEREWRRKEEEESLDDIEQLFSTHCFFYYWNRSYFSG
jgi:hypothetical protein